MSKTIFLCHASDDAIRIDPIISALQQAGYQVWADHFDQHPAKASRIDQQLNDCEAVIVALSPHSAQSKSCLAEWQKALLLNKHLYIAHFAPTHPVSEQAADFSQDDNAALAKLMSALHDQRPLENAALTYAQTNSDLAFTYITLAGEKDDIDYLQNAIDAFSEALRFYTPDATPHEYASTQYSLALTYSTLAEIEDDTDYLQNAVNAYTEALRIFTPDAAPLDYASTQNNLGTVYSNFAEIDGDPAYLLTAIKAYQEALRFRTPEAAPLEYASTQFNLGNVYGELAEVDDDEAYSHKAIHAYTEALRFRTPEADPFAYVRTQSNMGNVYENLGDMPSAAACWRESARVAALMGADEHAAQFTEWAEEAEDDFDDDDFDNDDDDDDD